MLDECLAWGFSILVIQKLGCLELPTHIKILNHLVMLQMDFNFISTNLDTTHEQCIITA